MQEKGLKKAVFLLFIAIIFLGIGFFILYPNILFQQNEKKLAEAAKRYFELNGSQLPTGERIKTIYLQELYHKSFVEGDIFIPYTKKTCSNTKSWVKVKKIQGNYKYYVYLDCGKLSSKIDHIGPTINLNGKSELTIGIGEEYKEPGIKSVIDDTDGELKIETVTIKGNVDTSKIGTYEVTYTATDSFSNKTNIKRTINVVQKLNSTIKKALGEKLNFQGYPDNNYIRLSNMDFKVYGLDNNSNVIVVADSDLANINFSKIDDWLKYYYDNLNEKAKKMIVKSKYCNMNVSEENLSTTECTSYTENRKIYIPSIVEINKAANANQNFMKTDTMSWTANKKVDTQEAYLTRNIFFGDELGKDYLPYNINDNYGIRPMFTIKGDSLIKNGDGTVDNPYTFGDTKTARGGTPLNQRNVGEYFQDYGTSWRIVKIEADGTTKAINNTTLSKYKENNYNDRLTFFPNTSGENYIYNPKEKGNIAYFINNSAIGYVDRSKLVNHEIQVPIYKKEIIYNEEVETKKYKAVLSSPDMYEIFSARVDNNNESTKSYWLKNSSKEKSYIAFITDIGVPYVGPINEQDAYGIRVVGYFKKDITIMSGEGTRINPYIIK